ncbi:methyltransferase [Pseudoscourfieldia marina]
MVLDVLRKPNANGRLLDIGANLGWFSLAAASCGFDVVAIEPFAMNQALVEASTCANGFHNEIKLIKSGLDTVARTCSLYQIPHVNIGDTHSVCSTSVDGEEMKRNFESKGYKKGHLEPLAAS